MKKAILFLGILMMLTLSGCVTIEAPPTSDTEVSSGQAVPGEDVKEMIVEDDCTPDWECGSWSDCDDGFHKRECIDSNDCGILNDKPAELDTCEMPVVEAEPIRLSGSGDEATGFFELEGGLAVFDLKHYGSGNFIVVLFDENGDRKGSIVNEIGIYDTSTIDEIDEGGKYLFDVTASGIWEIVITQPKPTTAPDTKEFSGTGQTYLGPFHMDKGLKRFQLEHTGSSNFIVVLYDKYGDRKGSIVNEIGPYEGSTADGVEEGIYYFDVMADGDWTINIE